MTRVHFSRFRQQPRLETLEDRTLMSTCHVTRFGDTGIGMGFRGDLRYCINKVNANPGADVIDFKISGDNINLASSLPELTSDIDIQGPGYEALWVAGMGNRIFKVGAGATVELSGLSLVLGSVEQSGVDDGGAIYNGGTLTIHDARFMQNGSVIMDHGGAIYNAGTLTMRDSLLTGNRAENGGGIYNAGNMTIETTVITDNLAAALTGSPRGGGIFNAGTMSITSSSVIDNEAREDETPWGGGIYNIGMLWIDSSTVADNSAVNSTGTNAYGGGICNFVGGSIVIRNSTIAQNQSTFGGGGIMQFGTAINIDHTTIAGNLAEVGGGMWSEIDNTITIRNTIIATNTVQDSELGPDFVGQLVSLGHNLIGDTTAGGGYQPNDLQNVDPMLGPLADNGGQTQTMALLPGSPAIDAGDTTNAPPWDQRGPGFPRVVNGIIDIGAFEVQATGAPTSPDLLALLITMDFCDE